jgi:glyceraldehyde-3-phosphate dehydrogenase (NADP+)
MNIPEKYQIKDIISQKSYLVNGELRQWNGESSQVFSSISSTEPYQPTLLGSIPNLGEKEAIESLDAAVAAYDRGQGLWPTMKVEDRISCMKKFVEQMKTKRNC